MRAHKTGIKVTAEQYQKIKRTIGTCRFVYNLFLATNKERYDNKLPYINNENFSKWLNNEYLKDNPDKLWIKEASSKSVRRSMDNAHTAYMKFFNKETSYPKFKKKANQDVKMYFVRNEKTKPIECERHRIKIPTLGWVRIKEFGYLPTNGSIISGTVSIKADKVYVSVISDNKADIKINNINEGIGIDLGLADTAILSNGIKYKNINKTKKVKKLKRKLKREQRRLSKKYRDFKARKEKATRQNVNKQIVKVQVIHQRLTNIRNDYQNKIVSSIIKQKPSFITIEDLNIKGMMKNRHLSKAISEQKLYTLTLKLTIKAHMNNIEVRKVDRFYPSSKLCNACGTKKTDLKLSDRIYKCTCGYEQDRDINAAMNLRDAKIYNVA